MLFLHRGETSRLVAGLKSRIVLLHGRSAPSVGGGASRHRLTSRFASCFLCWTQQVCTCLLVCVHVNARARAAPRCSWEDKDSTTDREELPRAVAKGNETGTKQETRPRSCSPPTAWSGQNKKYSTRTVVVVVRLAPPPRSIRITLTIALPSLNVLPRVSPTVRTCTYISFDDRAKRSAMMSTANRPRGRV